MPAHLSSTLGHALKMYTRACRSEPDYSKNKTYQQGQREGQADRAKNQDHSRKRHFKKDDDQKAHEAGYQKGRNN
jgi:hypothetical protein